MSITLADLADPYQDGIDCPFSAQPNGSHEAAGTAGPRRSLTAPLHERQKKLYVHLKVTGSLKRSSSCSKEDELEPDSPQWTPPTNPIFSPSAATAISGSPASSFIENKMIAPNVGAQGVIMPLNRSISFSLPVESTFSMTSSTNSSANGAERMADPEFHCIPSAVNPVRAEPSSPSFVANSFVRAESSHSSGRPSADNMFASTCTSDWRNNSRPIPANFGRSGGPVSRAFDQVVEVVSSWRKSLTLPRKEQHTGWRSRAVLDFRRRAASLRRIVSPKRVIAHALPKPCTAVLRDCEVDVGHAIQTLQSILEARFDASLDVRRDPDPSDQATGCLQRDAKIMEFKARVRISLWGKVSEFPIIVTAIRRGSTKVDIRIRRCSTNLAATSTGEFDWFCTRVYEALRSVFHVRRPIYVR